MKLTPDGHALLAEGAELRRDRLRGTPARVPDTDVLAAPGLVGAVVAEIAERSAEPAGSPATAPARPGRAAMTSSRGTTA